MTRRPLALLAALAASTALAACGASSTPASTDAAPSTPAAPTSAAVPGQAEAPDPATSSPSIDSPTPTPTASAAAGSSGSGVIRLSENAEIPEDKGTSLLPYLTFDAPTGWRQTIKDQDGVDQWKNTATRCQLTTTNNRGETAALDGIATTGQMSSVEATMRDGVDIHMIEKSGPVTVPWPASRPLQFDTLTVTYTARDGSGDWTSHFAFRSVSGEGLELAANVSCPTAAVTKNPALTTAPLKKLRVADALHR